jgi:excisionase family DNA binding protein
LASSRHSPTVPKVDVRTRFHSDGRPLLDIGSASERLGCSERFLRRLVQERRIPFVKLAGTRVRFLAPDLDRWVESQRVDALR